MVMRVSASVGSRLSITSATPIGGRLTEPLFRRRRRRNHRRRLARLRGCAALWQLRDGGATAAIATMALFLRGTRLPAKRS